MGKYIVVQTNQKITGEVLIEIIDKTIPGLVLPEIVYNIKKKLGCIFVENHKSESLVLKRGQTIGPVTSCIVTQEEQGQTPAERSDATQSVTGTTNDMAGLKADSVQSVENRKFYETKEEKRQFIYESF